MTLESLPSADDAYQDGWEDPIVAEVRRTREEIFAEFGYDLHAYAAHIMAAQEEAKKRGVVYASPRTRRVQAQTQAKPDAT